jgi:threonine aldolase
MRHAMATAPVGDDQFGEDPTVNALQQRIAALLGKESALWMPSGTMANQAALRLLTCPGDEVIVGRGSHAVWHEAGASAANAGVQFAEIGDGGVFTASEFLAAVKPRGHVIYPPTTLVEVENTHNRGGGIVFSPQDAAQICEAARSRDVASYLDGARLWNAAVALDVPPADLARPFDLVSVALSKGLGAPAGSVLAGSAPLIARLVRIRRMLGGAMRQVGVLAAAGLYALDHHLPLLVQDHEHAKTMAAVLAAHPQVQLDLSTVQTNIVIFHLAPTAPDAETVVERARERDVLLFAFGPRTLRIVTHYDVSREACARAADTLVSVIR